jgi:hypothetical protein
MLAWFPADKVWAGDASPTPSGSQAPSERKAGIRLPDGLVDIDGNGRLTPIPLHSAYIYPTMVVGLSQSEALIFGMRDRRQGQVQTGITAVVDMESVLVVVRADGDQLIQLGTSDGSVNLVGATEDSAFLLRGDRLVRRSLATGNEERVGAADQIAELIRQGWRVGSVESDSAVLLRTDSSGLHAMTVSLSTRARSNVALVCDITPNQKNKDSVSNLRLAPGGRYVACTYRTGDQADTAKLTVTDMTTGRRVVERDLPSSMQLSAHPNGLMAWADEHTLRLGLVALPANADRLYDLSEVLRIETVKV